MSSAGDEAVCSTRLILPMLLPVMHATTCNSEIHVTETEITEICILLQWTANQAKHSLAHGAANWHIAAHCEKKQENKECCRNGACNGCTLQHRSTVTAICQQQLTDQQNIRT